jgi:hypothetical protein
VDRVLCVEVMFDRDPMLLGLRLTHSDSGPQELQQLEVLVRDVHPTGLDAGDVQHLLQELAQVGAGQGVVSALDFVERFAQAGDLS